MWNFTGGGRKLLILTLSCTSHFPAVEPFCLLHLLKKDLSFKKKGGGMGWGGQSSLFGRFVLKIFNWFGVICACFPIWAKSSSEGLHVVGCPDQSLDVQGVPHARHRFDDATVKTPGYFWLWSEFTCLCQAFSKFTIPHPPSIPPPFFF